MKTLSKSRLSVLLLLGTTSTLSYGYDWNGIYFGINTGYNSGSFTPSNLGLNEGGVLSKFLEEIPLQNTRGNDFNPNTESLSNAQRKDFNVGKISLGLQLGHLYQSTNSNWVSGWEINLQTFRKKKKHDPISYSHYGNPTLWEGDNKITLAEGKSQIRFNAKTKFLLGYQVNERWLPYATAGVSIAKVNLTLGKVNTSCSRGGEDLNFFCEDLNDYSWAKERFTQSHSYIQYGINYGIGVFYAFNKHWLINAEVSNTLLRPISGYKDTKLSGSFHSFNVGLSYKF